jgi:flavodoxin
VQRLRGLCPILQSRVHRSQGQDGGYPNWWGTMPMAVWIFLEAHDFAGKTILPFCTHEGSGLGQSERDIRSLCPGARVLRGLAIRGGSVRKAEQTIAAWLQENRVTA